MKFVTRLLIAMLLLTLPLVMTATATADPPAYFAWTASATAGQSGCSVNAMVADARGNLYLAGISSAHWGNPRRPYTGGSDGFVAKYTPSGELVWNTFLGSGHTDTATCLALDEQGNVAVAGTSDNTWGVPLNHFAGGSDAFVALLDADGNLQWHTFLGGSGADGATGVCMTGSGAITVAGTSATAWGSPLRPFSGGASDAFVARLSAAGSMQWLTFLGGMGDDSANALVQDTAGNLTVAGASTATWNAGSVKPLYPYAGGSDACIVHLDNDGKILWHAFFGAASRTPFGQTDWPIYYYDTAWALALGDDGSIFMDGWSNDTWSVAGVAPLPGSLYYGGVFVIKLDATGRYQWHTFAGAHDDYFQIPVPLALAQDGSIYFACFAFNQWGNPLNGTGAKGGVYLVKLAPDGRFLWNLFPGGDLFPINALALPPTGGLFLSGQLSDSGGALARLGDFRTVLFSAGYGCESIHGQTAQAVTDGYDCTPVSVMPAEGFSFVDWSGNDGFTAHTPTLTVTSVHQDMEITAHFVSNMAIGLAAQRSNRLAGLYGRVTFSVSNGDVFRVTRYCVERRANRADSGYQQVKFILVSELLNYSYSYDDVLPNTKDTYIYRVSALNSMGRAIGVSDEVSI